MACFVGETHNGVGRFSAAISPVDRENIAHWQFYHSIVVTLGITLVKFSVGFYLLRLVTKKLYKWALIVILSKSLIP